MENLEKNIFKETLRQELDYQDIKVKELSAMTGISSRTLEGYLGSRASIPPADVAVKIAFALNVTVEYLVTGKNQQDDEDKTSDETNSDNLSENIKTLSSDKQRFLNQIFFVMQSYDITLKRQRC